MTRVLPVAVFFVAVDVFVRQIHAAGEGGFAVDDGDLSVVPVIIMCGDKRLQRCEDLTLNAEFLQLPVVVPGQQGKFAGGTLPYGYKSENKKMVIVSTHL